MEVRTYYTKEIPKLLFEVHGWVEGFPIGEQLDTVKRIILDIIEEDFKKLQISIKEDLHLKLTNEEEMYKNLILNNKPVNTKG